LNRCDFSSISTCLKNHISESNQMSQPDFLYELFEDFMDDPANQDFSMDNGLVCRWMTGQAKISPKISAYYSKPSNQEKLAHTIHQNLLPLMSDCNMAIQDIYTLFIQDESISDAKKKNLTPLHKPASSRFFNSPLYSSRLMDVTCGKSAFPLRYASTILSYAPTGNRHLQTDIGILPAGFHSPRKISASSSSVSAE